MDDKELDAYCEAWVNWCYTRRFYIQPGAQNILARMQPSKSGQPPNARNDPDMPYFNMAIHAMADMPEHQVTFACFRLAYIEQSANVKREAEKIGISRPTYYNRSKSFARAAYSLSKSLKNASQAVSILECATID